MYKQNEMEVEKGINYWEKGRVRKDFGVTWSGRIDKGLS